MALIIKMNNDNNVTIRNVLFLSGWTAHRGKAESFDYYQQAIRAAFSSQGWRVFGKSITCEADVRAAYDEVNEITTDPLLVVYTGHVERAEKPVKTSKRGRTIITPTTIPRIEPLCTAFDLTKIERPCIRSTATAGGGDTSGSDTEVDQPVTKRRRIDGVDGNNNNLSFIIDACHVEDNRGRCVRKDAVTVKSMVIDKDPPLSIVNNHIDWLNPAHNFTMFTPRGTVVAGGTALNLTITTLIMSNGEMGISDIALFMNHAFHENIVIDTCVETNEKNGSSLPNILLRYTDPDFKSADPPVETPSQSLDCKI